MGHLSSRPLRPVSHAQGPGNPSRRVFLSGMSTARSCQCRPRAFGICTYSSLMTSFSSPRVGITISERPLKSPQ
jgi:hypothetical protein